MKSPPKKTPHIKVDNKKDNYITWFEIPATNFERAVNFYNQIFQIELLTNEMNGYSMAYFPTKEGAGGAIICGEGSFPSDKGPLIYLNGGNDLNDVLSKVESSGGRVLMQKQQINAEAGCFALFIDSEGNKLALHSKS